MVRISDLKRLSIVAVVILSACSGARDEQAGWRDTTGIGRQNANLSADVDACAAEMNRKNTVVPAGYASGPGPGLFGACMTSRGWQRVY